MSNGTQVGERPLRYAPRSITTLPADQVHGWTVKRYGISALRETPQAEVFDFGRLTVCLSLPDSYGDALSYGYNVVHEDEDGCYAVVGWWSRNRVILHTRTWLAGWTELTVPVEAPGHATACIWEAVPMAHERDAWVRHVVRPERPDADAYLASTVSGWF
ncbi:hypothetical protein [Actinosynnema sp. ALI-1.44]|uniref:hypothetical protein n=1 Tax=Actinosynnema sp. ALI-1.44 TaxID=1933779 RepID=UPI000A06ADC6|nr:hypothetical protein [Actinosynnema sp. ALI-1.44]